ncbi:sodium channel protein Nach-like isoform X1 [Armigeres subalbatus]|uniref:sodium channel protein Nach-like isoform X1 n=1 Tax=Armigeres subalbatus TaxID=124917 RepID=UPI002ED00105
MFTAARLHRSIDRARSQSDDFFSHSSVHGLQYLASESGRRSPIERTLWATIFLVSISTCAILGREIYRKWQQTPVIIGINERMTSIWEIPLPGMTICPDFPLTNFTVRCEKDCEITKTFVGESVCRTINSLSMEEMFQSDVLENAENYPYLRGINKTSSWDLDTGYDNSMNIEDSYHSYPKRFIFGMGGQFLDIEIQYRKADSNNTEGREQFFSIILHLPNEYPQKVNGFHTIPAGYRFVLHLTPQMMITSEELRSYSPHKRQCYYQDEKRLKYFKHYTEANCKLEWYDNLSEQCNCTMFPVPDKTDSTLCSLSDSNANCLIDSWHSVRNMTLLNQIQQVQNYTMVKLSEEVCIPSCTSISYDADISSLTSSPTSPAEPTITTTVRAQFRSPQFVAWKRRELFSTVDLVASIGGLAGLFVGASLLSIVEVIYFFTIRPIIAGKRLTYQIPSEDDEDDDFDYHRRSTTHYATTSTADCAKGN